MRVPLLEVAPLANDRVRPFAGSRPFLATGGLSEGNPLVTTNVSYEHRPSRADLTVRPGDVCFARMQATRKVLHIGENSDCLVVSTGFAILRPKSNRLIPRYLFHWIRSEEFQAAKDLLCTGATQRAITNSGISQLTLPLLGLGEQRRVVDILDGADALRVRRREAVGHLETLKQSIFLDMFGDPSANPKDWIQSHLGDVSIQITDGEHATPPRSESGIKLLSARNVRDGYLDFSKTDFVEQAVYEKLRKRCDPTLGDLLISCSGTIGRVARVATNEPLALVRSVAFVRPDHNVLDSVFLEYQLRTSALQRQMKRAAKASSQANLFQGPVKKLSVVVPPVELQAEFAARIVTAEHIGALQTQSQSGVEEVLLSIQARAFAGAL